MRSLNEKDGTKNIKGEKEKKQTRNNRKRNFRSGPAIKGIYWIKMATLECFAGWFLKGQII